MSILVGFTANRLILNSSNFRREIVGLERITDVYTARTQDAKSFQEIIKNGESHRNITAYLTPIPSERFENMLVENVSTTNNPGDITTFNVTYVGLARDLYPKPIISLQPVDVFAFNPFSVTIEFVEYIGEIASQYEIAFLRKYKTGNPIPSKINGYATIKSSIPSFYGDIGGAILSQVDLSKSDFFAPALAAYTQASAEEVFDRSFRLPTNPTTPGTSIPTVQYSGLCIKGLSYSRYGNYCHASIVASDTAYYSYAAGETAVFRSI